MRGDDGAGIEVARRLRGLAAEAGIDVRAQQGEPAGLIDAWSGRKAVLVVDTIRSGAEPGTICRFDASREPLPAQLRGSPSTHALGLAEAIELARSGAATASSGRVRVTGSRRERRSPMRSRRRFPRSPPWSSTRPGGNRAIRAIHLAEIRVFRSAPPTNADVLASGSWNTETSLPASARHT